jgi:hypothetical protein
LWSPSKRTCFAQQARGDADASRPQVTIGGDLRFYGCHRTGAAQPAAAFADSHIAFFTMVPNGRDVPRGRPRPPNLPCVVARPPAHATPAEPLEPSPWILRMDPAFPAPLGE